MKTLAIVGRVLAKTVFAIGRLIEKIDPPKPTWLVAGCDSWGDGYVITHVSTQGQVMRCQFDPQTLSFDQWPPNSYLDREAVERLLAKKVTSRPGAACA